LLATWYGLSDVALAGALCDRASFRRFCGFARDEATPERTAGVALPAPACRAGARRGLFAAIARDLEAKGATVRKGTSPQSLTAIASLIDATIIGSASKGDKEAASGHRTRAPAHGYKAHIAAAKDSGIIRDIETTPANEPDVAIAPSIIPDKPEFMPTKPMMRFRSKRRLKPRWNRKAFARKGHRWLSAEKLEARNRPPRPILGRRLSTNSFFIASRRNLSRNALLPRQDRDLRNLETQLTIRGHCLQRQTPLAAAKRLSGFEQAPSKPGPSTKPKTSSPSRRSTGDFRTITIIQAIPPAKSAPHTGLETLWYDWSRPLSVQMT
jgi:IS5 family transposase